MVRCCQSVKESALPGPDDIALKGINCLLVQIIKVGMLQGLLGLQKHSLHLRQCCAALMLLNWRRAEAHDNCCRAAV